VYEDWSLIMKVIVPANNKGGVGKTKLSILLSEYISVVLGKKVLAIDFDPQCNFSQRFLSMEIDPATPGGKIPPIYPEYEPEEFEGIGPEGRSSIADIFFGGLVYPYETYIENLDMTPAHADRLLEAESVRRSEVIDKVHKQLGLFLEMPDLQEMYDVVIIDTAPSKGPLTISAIKAATHMVIPSIMEEQPIQGVYGMLQLWKQEALSRDPSRPLELVGVLPNMFRPINLHRDMLRSLRETEFVKQYIMPVSLGSRASFSEVDAEGAKPESIFDLPDSNKAKDEAIAVCKYIAQNVFGGN
ncbi:MAG: ParA family protein, partial [Nitrospiria bacterium]